jgi:hypothetical protein
VTFLDATQTPVMIVLSGLVGGVVAIVLMAVMDWLSDRGRDE